MSNVKFKRSLIGKEDVLFVEPDKINDKVEQERNNKKVLVSPIKAEDFVFGVGDKKGEKITNYFLSGTAKSDLLTEINNFKTSDSVWADLKSQDPSKSTTLNIVLNENGNEIDFKEIEAYKLAEIIIKNFVKGQKKNTSLIDSFLSTFNSTDSMEKVDALFLFGYKPTISTYDYNEEYTDINDSHRKTSVFLDDMSVIFNRPTEPFFKNKRDNVVISSKNILVGEEDFEGMENYKIKDIYGFNSLGEYSKGIFNVFGEDFLLEENYSKVLDVKDGGNMNILAFLSAVSYNQYSKAGIDTSSLEEKLNYYKSIEFNTKYFFFDEEDTKSLSDYKYREKVTGVKDDIFLGFPKFVEGLKVFTYGKILMFLAKDLEGNSIPLNFVLPDKSFSTGLLQDGFLFGFNFTKSLPTNNINRDYLDIPNQNDVVLFSMVDSEKRSFFYEFKLSSGNSNLKIPYNKFTCIFNKSLITGDFTVSKSPYTYDKTFLVPLIEF